MPLREKAIPGNKKRVRPFLASPVFASVVAWSVLANVRGDRNATSTFLPVELQGELHNARVKDGRNKTRCRR